MESTIVDGLTIRAWEGAICEHSKQSLAPLHAPLRDLSEPNGLPSLCTAIELVEGQRDREGADSEAQSAAAKRTLMAASSVAAESSAQYVGQVSQWSMLHGSNGGHPNPMGDDEGGETEGTDQVTFFFATFRCGSYQFP